MRDRVPTALALVVCFLPARAFAQPPPPPAQSLPPPPASQQPPLPMPPPPPAGAGPGGVLPPAPAVAPAAPVSPPGGAAQEARVREAPRNACGVLEAPTCSLFWVPMLSVVAPGVGQSRDLRAPWPYALGGAAGLVGTVVFAARLARRTEGGQLTGTQPFGSGLEGIGDVDVQGLLVASQTYQTAGFLSAYDTYRYRMVEQLGLEGQQFRSTSDLLWAPAHFQSALRPTVFVPLLAAAALGAFGAHDGLAPGDTPFGRLRLRDGLFTLGVSYNAGVGEEAFFRGFLQSYLEHRWGWNRWLANGLQGTLFGLAHGAVDARIGIGLYLGWLAQANDYDLTDAIFVHAWWDVIILTSAFAVARATRAPAPSVFVTLPPLVF